MAESLKNRTVNGVVWSAIDRFSALGIQIVCSLIIAHLLTPEDFGILGMITVFSAIGLVIIDSVFGLALIRRNDVTELDYSSVFYLNLFLAIICYTVLYCVSPLIADFYNLEPLTQICRVTFLVLPINAFGLIQNTILLKKIDFKTIAIASLASSLFSGIIGIILAYNIRNVWALVIQNISMYGLRSIILWCVGHWKPMLRFSITSIKSMWSYSMNLLGFGLISSLTQNIYPLVIGKFYNATQLGFYSQADRLQKLPATSITEVIQRVCFPVLSEVKEDIYRMREAYRKIIMTTFFIVFPLMMLLIGIANELIMLLLGPQWSESILYFQILCIVGALYPLHSINLNILNVVGKSRLSLVLEVARKVILILLIIIAIKYDMIILVLAQVVYSIIVLFLNMYYSGREIDYGIIQQFRDISPTILLSLISLGLISLFIYIPYQHEFVLLVIKCLTFIISFFMLNRIFKTQSYSFAIPILANLIKQIR